MISIQTNVNSLIAQQNLSVNSAFQSKTIAQLTSGYRINQSGDDAAGLAVANKFRSTVAELTQGVSNGNDATAQLQIMDGGMSNISSILDRLKTLATQSASGTFTGSRTTLNSEFQSDLLEIDRQSQSIGLNTGGVFAKNLSVYLGVGSGSQSMQNGLVSLDLTQSAVDSQSLGMRGMEVVNLTSGSLAGTNAGVDIGATSTTSVENIVNNTTGVNANQQATAGYAALEFSGSGFSDAGKVGISVNLAGVTDVATLVTAVNSTIQAAGNGTTAAATAFKNANIVASVHTDSGGGQQLAFSSSTSAFQVQAGDQMANALLGNVSVVGGVAKGAAVAATAATTVTGATTTAGSLTQGQVVKLVVIGGGLASPVTLQVNTAGGTAVTTSGAITDLENQFSGSAVLQAAGLSMTGSSTAGSQLTFTSASGQAFNIEMTGDTSNLLGLGSFSADAAGHADYTEITAGTAYSAATVTGSATTTGLAAGLEISLNGQQATALTAIDLTAGAHAVAASLTSSAPITGGFTNTAGQVDLTATTDQANITVINNGVANNQAFTFGANTAESQATAVSSGMTQSGFGGYTETLTGTSAGRSDQFTIALDGGAAHTVTLDNTYASGSVGAASFLTDLQTVIDASGIGAGKVVASWALVGGAHTGALTLTSAATNATGTASSLSIGAATNATSGAAASTLTSTTGFPISVTAAAHNNQFSVSVNGAAAMTLTLADNTAYTATTFLAAVQNAIANAGSGNTNSLGTNQTGTVSANWALDGSGLHTGALTLTSATTGAGSTVSIGQATYGTAAVQQSSLTDTAGNITGGAKTIVAGTSDQLTLAVDGGPSVTVVLAAAPYTTSASLLGEINTEIGSSALSGKVIASWATGGHLLLTSLSTNGAASTVNVSVSAHDASVILGLTAGTTAGTAQNNTGDVSAGLTKNVVNPGNPTAANGGLGVIGIAAGLTHGGNDAPQTVQSIAATIQAAFGVNAVVTVSNDNKISIASATKGANSSVLLNATANSVYGTLNLTSPVVPGLNSSIGDVVNNLNAQFSANGTAYQAAGLTAIATKADGTVDVGTPGNNVFVSILSNNGTQFRLNAVGAPAVATAAKLASSVTDASFSATTPLTVTLNTNDKINVAVGAGGVAQTLQVAAGIYTTATGAGSFLAAVQAAIAASVDPTNGIAGKVTAGWDAATRQLTFTSVATGSAASVTVSAAPSGNTGLANLGFGTGSTSSGQLSSTTENTGFGVAGRTFTAATPGSSGTAMSTLNAYGISNSGAFTFSALQYGSDKQALTFSATDANGTLETETITLQNNASVNRAGASIDDAVAYLNQQLQQTTANPALQKIVAVKQANAGGTAEAINFVSSLSNFTVGVAATANGDGLNSGLATYRTSAANGSGANMSIDTAAGAMAAITAIAAAIDKLGAAQATIGKGENQLTYAVNLAQSQITNFSAAESQIRDANVAQQAANLSKAQVLTQASIAAMAQANSAPQAVLTLLRG